MESHHINSILGKLININFYYLSNHKKYFLEILNIETYTKISVQYFGSTFNDKHVVKYNNNNLFLKNFQNKILLDVHPNNTFYFFLIKLKTQEKFIEIYGNKWFNKKDAMNNITYTIDDEKITEYFQSRNNSTQTNKQEDTESSSSEDKQLLLKKQKWFWTTEDDKSDSDSESDTSNNPDSAENLDEEDEEHDELKEEHISDDEHLEEITITVENDNNNET